MIRKIKIAIHKYYLEILAAEISSIARYFDRIIQLAPRPDDVGKLLDAISNPDKIISQSIQSLPGSQKEKDSPSFILLNTNLNYDFEIQNNLIALRSYLSRESCLACVLYNPYLRCFHNILRIFSSDLASPNTFLTRLQLENLAKISGFEVTRYRNVLFCPFKLWGLGSLINALLPAIPFLRWFSFCCVAYLRPVIKEAGLPSISILIPARNEKGNIENAIKRLPYMDGADIEVIFIEGNSSDGTFAEILRVKELFAKQYNIKAYQQSNKGKCDAVRLGFAKAQNDLVAILDADLTMPPELLEMFYYAYRNGHGDLINGNRLVYPYEKNAMRFLNKLGNIFFAKALSFVLDCPFGDVLCGTKLLSRKNYQKFIAWRQDFGDFDPFGDFELLYPAGELALRVIDVPIHYKGRSYGSTNINRFRDGLILLKMTLIGLFKIKLGKVK